MPRSLKKGPFIDLRFAEEVEKAVKRGEAPAHLVPSFNNLSNAIGLTIAVHNGRQHVPVFCFRRMVGPQAG
ncbi:ribosomal protein S19 family protein [Salmonella enterica subsp. enterica]|nr:ribosomal protein S19 family protein [Salmonella enterica subsp. enterica]